MIVWPYDISFGVAKAHHEKLSSTKFSLPTRADRTTPKFRQHPPARYENCNRHYLALQAIIFVTSRSPLVNIIFRRHRGPRHEYFRYQPPPVRREIFVNTPARLVKRN